MIKNTIKFVTTEANPVSVVFVVVVVVVVVVTHYFETSSCTMKDKLHFC